MTNTVTLDLKRYEGLLLKEKAVNERKVIWNSPIFYGRLSTYLIDNETELTRCFENDLKEIDKKYTDLDKKYIDCSLQLNIIKSKWWYKLFTKFSK